jgi:hypothetical protein
MNAPPEKRISTRAAASYLGVTTKHVVRLVKAKALDGIDVGLPGADRPTYGITLASVRAFLASRSDDIGLEGLSAAARVDSDGVQPDAGR